MARDYSLLYCYCVNFKIESLHQRGFLVWSILFLTELILFNIGCSGDVAFEVCSGGVARLGIVIYMLANHSPILNNHFGVL